MTDEEKRQQRAMLLLEYEEAQQAARLADSIQDVAHLLFHAKASYSQAQNPRTALSLQIRGQAERYRAALDFDALLSLLDDLDAAERRLADLKQRKTALNLPER